MKSSRDIFILREEIETTVSRFYGGCERFFARLHSTRRTYPQAGTLAHISVCSGRADHLTFGQRCVNVLNMIGFRKLVLPLFDKAIEARFWNKIEIPTDFYHGCWLWDASLTPTGYGQFAPKQGTLLLAHRASWSLWYGEEIPEGLVLDHVCHVRHCVNPVHVFPTTQADNSKRKRPKPRSRPF